MELLFKYGGIDMKTKDEKGKNLLEIAVQYNAVNCIKQIREHEG